MYSEKNYTYDAFISYRHTQPDKTVAERLHRLLETFKIPKSIVKSSGKKRISRVFRDQDELPTSSNLAENITRALESSEYLIVVCSPRTPQSQWVLKEIETFQKLHGHDRILTLLIDGEPNESFPSQLSFIKKTQTMEDGSSIESTIEIEPLAADIRATSEKEMLKKLKTEVLRLLSPMLNCSYDDLKLRHKERLIKSVLTASISLSAFFLAFGSFSTYQALLINQKSQEISRQSDEINKQANEINQKNIEITSQIKETQIVQSKYLADISNSYFEDGDRYRAILAAQAALPNNLSEPSRPYVIEAEYALSQALAVYEVDSYFDGDIVLDHNMPVDSIIESPDGKTLLTFSSDGFIYIWDTADGSCLGCFFTNDSGEYKNTFFVDNNSFVTTFYEKGRGKYFCCINTNGSIIWQSDIEAGLVAYNPDKNLLAIYSSSVTYESGNNERNVIFLVDSLTGNILFKTSINDFLEDSSPDYLESIYLNCIAMNGESNVISFGTNTGKVYTINCTDGEHISTVTTENKTVENIVFSNDGHMIVHSSLLKDPFKNIEGNACLEIFPPQTTVPSFKQTFPFAGIKKIRFLQTDPDKIVFIEWERINILDIKTGILESTFISSDYITDFYLKDDMIVISSNDGIIKFFLIQEDKSLVEVPDFRIFRDDSIKNVIIANKKLIFSLFASNNVYLYRAISNDKNIALNGHTGIISDVLYSPDESLALSFTHDLFLGEICLWDVKKHELIVSKSFNNEVWVSDACFINNETILLSFSNLSSTNLLTIRASDLSTISEIQSDGPFYINKDLSIIAIRQSDDIYLYKLPELVYLSDIEEIPTNNFSITNNNKLFTITRFKNASIIDISNKKTIHIYKSDALSNGIISNNGELCALSFSDKRIKLFDTGNTFKEIVSLDNILLDIEFMTFSPDNKLLIVQFLDNSIHIYDTYNGNLKNVFAKDYINSSLKKVKFSQNNDKVALITLGTSYIIDLQSFKMLASASITDINKSFSYFLTRGGLNNKAAYIVPCYTTQMLLDEANKQLNGRTLTDKEKAEMFIN